MNIKKCDNLLKNRMGFAFKDVVMVFLILAALSCSKEVKEYPRPQLPKKSQSIPDPTNTLSGKTENLDIEYTVFGCACPNWIQVKNIKSVKEQGLEALYFYVEPADDSLQLPVYFDASRHFLRVKGQFYKKKDLPKGIILNEEILPRARVFRYTDLEVLDKPDFKPDTQIETMVLNYNTVACTCAQWSKSDTEENFVRRDYYWLEPANKKLIDADRLFDGTHLPVRIRVTGQIVAENGFPKNKNLAKVNENEAGKVFRYTRIEVLRK